MYPFYIFVLSSSQAAHSSSVHFGLLFLVVVYFQSPPHVPSALVGRGMRFVWNTGSRPCHYEGAGFGQFLCWHLLVAGIGAYCSGGGLGPILLLGAASLQHHFPLFNRPPHQCPPRAQSAAIRWIPLTVCVSSTGCLSAGAGTGPGATGTAAEFILLLFVIYVSSCLAASSFSCS